MRRIWSVVAFLSLVLASGVPALVQAAAVSGGIEASEVAAQNAAPPVDLAAAALNPDDLNTVGRPGFGQETSVFFTQWTELAQSDANLGPHAPTLRC